ncbi:MAG: cation-transporting P-type ATPase, partial [bacterium]
MTRSLPLDRLCGRLTEAGGLSRAQAEEQLRRFGRNTITELGERPWWTAVRDTARDPMIWFLVGTGVLYASLGDLVEAGTLLVAVLPLIGMDVVLHWRTQASTEGLRSHLAATATVLRDGVRTAIPAVDVVPGDLAFVEAGEAFPADGVIVGGHRLQVEESALTGESYPVRKRPLATIPTNDAEVAVDGGHWGMAGTRLLTGRASLRVAFTGGETRYGEIVRTARGGSRERTPLQTAIAGLVSVLVVAAIVACATLAIVRLRQGYGWLDAVVSALTLAVAALPEEFPVVFTFFLGVGVYRLARRQALVRRAVSVENIGRVSCICSDKTGTITEGRLRLTHLVPAGDCDELRLLEIAVIASRPDGGDLLDHAIQHAATGRGVMPAVEDIERLPFTEDTRRETAIVRATRTPVGGVFAASKGALEVILDMTRLDAAERARWNDRARAFASEGHKVIACAWQPLDAEHWPGGEPHHGYHFAGLLCFEDPVREGVAGAIAVCRQAGIRTIMVTGDHPLTARAVADAIGLGGSAPAVITADEMERRLASGADGDLDTVDVVARAVPLQKLHLVQALQRRGHIVAVTGDGVNDVPALQAADVGIAMGEHGTRSAREVASIVLRDDNFRTIVRAIAEGRQLFRNLQLSFAYLLMIHMPLVITAAVIPLAGYPVLYLPIHIVWLELIIHPTALLGFQDLATTERLAPAAPGRVARFFSNADWLRIVLVGAAVTVMVTAGYARSLGGEHNVEHARAMALAVLTMTSAALTAALSQLRTRGARGLAAATVGLSLGLIQIPDLSRLLHMAPLHADDWGMAVAAAMLTGLPVL